MPWGSEHIRKLDNSYTLAEKIIESRNFGGLGMHKKTCTSKSKEMNDSLIVGGRGRSRKAIGHHLENFFR
jgi:hypothetical protein